MTKNENEMLHRIIRGVNVKVVNGKRAALGLVVLSKNKVAELEALKKSTFFQTMTLVEDRSDKNIFRTKLGSYAEGESFIEQVVDAAREAGVGAEAAAPAANEEQLVDEKVDALVKKMNLKSAKTVA